MPAPHLDVPRAFAGSGDLPAPEAAALERQVRAAQTALVFNRARASNLFAPLVGVLVCWVLWHSIAHPLLVAWCAALVGVMAWREWIHRRFIGSSGADAQTLGRQYDLALLANGIVYGLLGTVLFPSQEPTLASGMLATLVGVAAVSVVVLSTKLRAVAAMTLPVLIPTIVVQFIEGTRLSIYMASGMSVFLVLIVMEGRQAAEHTLAMLRLRFRMDELATQRQQALDLAQRSSAVKSQFLATMSHEMRTPLHGILGITRLVRSARSDGDPKARAHHLEMIERTGEHLLGLINDVLDYSKIEGGHLRIEHADFELAALIESVSDLTRISAAEKGLALRLEFEPPSPCWVRADASRLRQVLLNLTGNAVKFTERGHIGVNVQRAADGATRFEVCDTGPGIAPAQRELIFGAFQQADGSFGRRHGGTGLGLTISRELARAMGGDLVCADRPVGGACFVLTLPLPAGEPVAPTCAAADLAEPMQGRVLLAEDNPVNALVAEALLQRAGVEVDLVGDGAQAVAHAAATRYSLILMDCQMPGMDGFEATARIRALEREAGLAEVPIVALTANALDSDRLRSIAAGMNDHLAKPFREQDLGALLKRYLG